MRKNIENQKLIAIVGGGPVGLYTALLFAEKYDNIHLAIFEKRLQYSRSHTVYLDDSDDTTLTIPCSDPPIKLSGWIPIQRIEEQCKQQLQKFIISSFGVTVSFHHYEFTTMKSFLQQASALRITPEIIVFTSGAKSTVRQMYFGGDLYRTSYNNVCTVKYHRRSLLQRHEINEEPEPILQWNHHYRVSKLIECYFQSSRSSNSDHYWGVL